MPRATTKAVGCPTPSRTAAAGIEDNLRSLGVERAGRGEPAGPGEDEPDQLFTDQLGAMITARDEGAHRRHRAEQCRLRAAAARPGITEIACVQNPFNLIDRSSQPVLDECISRDIPFVPFFPLGSAFNEVNRCSPTTSSGRPRTGSGTPPAQIALAWTLNVADNILLIPGTSSPAHLEENLAVADIELDDETSAS